MNDADQPAIIVTGRTREVVIFIQKSILYLSRYWFLMASLFAIIILGAAILAPVLMAEGMTETGQAFYDFLAPHNHQLPQRSYFLFSQAGGIQSYSLAQILEWGADPHNVESYVGNSEIGFKMGLNHRMTAIFAAILIGGLAWGLAGEKPRIGKLWFVVLTLPLLADGVSHMISDNGGTNFRHTNQWASYLVGGWPAPFLEGTTIGSLNWLLRTVTGVLFGLALVWFIYPYLSAKFKPIRAKLEPKLRRVGAIK